MNNVITLENSKSYATEANLDKAIAKAGLDSVTEAVNGKGHTHTLRYIKCRNAEGRWTAVFMVSEHLSQCGGYAGIAQGFMAV